MSEKEYILDPALSAMSKEVDKLLIKRLDAIPVEQRMDAASMFQMLSAWREVQDTLIVGALEIRTLREKVKELENRIKDASLLMADWDGYYNPETKKGNVEELAKLIEEAFATLQGRSWRDDK